MSNILLVIFLGASLGFNIFLFLYFWKIKKVFKALMAGKIEEQNLTDALLKHHKHLKNLESELKSLQAKSEVLEKMAIQSIQKVGLIRYNPFRDTGSNQSFSIAFLDKKENGLIITSLYGREGMRIYTKPIVSGESEYQLTDEEKEAIKKAEGN